MQKTIPVTIIDFINYSSELLKERKINDARLNIELILCHVLNCNRTDLYLNFDKPLAKVEVKNFKEILLRRLKYEPLQYILGKVSFYGIDFLVNKNVLIPRQETELLVEKILEDIKKSDNKKVSIFEIGTGSGCISIALAKNLELKNIDFEIFSIDKSEDSIEVAMQNMMLNKIPADSVKFYIKDVFEIERLKGNFDYIVSNPPYISIDEYKKLDSEVKDYEPDLALTDFNNGLKFFERIFLLASDNKFTGKVFCEIGFDQKDSIEILLKKYSFSGYSFYKDYNSIERILEIKK